jgi:outer membrane protein TolC
MARALVQRAEVESAEAVVERRRAESVFARDRVKPALDAVVSYDRFGLADTRNPALAPIPGLPSEVPGGLEGDLGQSLQVLGDGDFDDTRIGLELAIPIGNRQARAGARIAEDVVQQAQADLERVRKAIRAEVLNAAAALDTAGQRIESARSARQAAEVQLSSERERFGVGLSTNFLVLTRQNDLASARLAEIEALTDYQTARTELARATGSLLADRGIELETE